MQVFFRHLSCQSIVLGAFVGAIELEPEWRQKNLHSWLLLFLFGPTITFMNTAVEIYGFYASQQVKDKLKARGSPHPTLTKQAKKVLRGWVLSTFIFVLPIGYLQGCVALRDYVSTASPLTGIIVVFSVNIFKQALGFCGISIAIPLSKSNFSATDSMAFLLHAFLTFGTRLLVTSLPGATSIVVVSVTTSMLDLTVSRLVLQASHRHVCNLEDERDVAFNQGGTQSHRQTDLVLKVRLRLLHARRRMSTEVISLVNEFFTEFYCTAVAIACGMVFRDSEIITLLNIEVTWDELPVFIALQFGTAPDSAR